MRKHVEGSDTYKAALALRSHGIKVVREGKSRHIVDGVRVGDHVLKLLGRIAKGIERDARQN